MQFGSSAMSLAEQAIVQRWRDQYEISQHERSESFHCYLLIVVTVLDEVSSARQQSKFTTLSPLWPLAKSFQCLWGVDRVVLDRCDLSILEFIFGSIMNGMMKMQCIWNILISASGSANLRSCWSSSRPWIHSNSGSGEGLLRLS